MAKISELTKEELTLLGGGLALMKKSFERSITVHRDDSALVAIYTQKVQAVDALSVKLTQLELI